MIAALTGCSDKTTEVDKPATFEPTQVSLAFVGSEACGECHLESFEAWEGSHHQQAMAAAKPSNVLADFAGRALKHFGEHIGFDSPGGSAAMVLSGADGSEQPYPVSHVFGVEPLQQYLVPGPRGRYQVPPVAWDTRPEADGGQRWFHLYPDDEIGPTDPLHWTGALLNWNSQCAECHSTALRKNYRFDGDRYATTWEEISVGCEACHGRGSRHVAWAENGVNSATRNAGLEIDLTDDYTWIMDPQRGIARRSPELRRQRQPEACGRCHARRATYSDDYPYGRPLLDTHRLALIEPDLYFPDGQILDEVYVYGSFLQSAMYQAGVQCSDCHDPHSGTLRSPGASVCATCHLPDRFNVVEHHGHAADQVTCLDCHMPKRTYMGNDDRGDHAFKVPRPDLSVALGVPNACENCHSEQDAAWAVDQIAASHPDGRQTEPHFATEMHGAWQGTPEGLFGAAQVAGDPSISPIIRASALRALRGNMTSPALLDAVATGLKDREAIIRFGAIQALESVAPEQAVPLALPLLTDSVRAVRIEAARVVAPADGQLPASQQTTFDRAAKDLLDAERYQFDREFGHLNSGNFYLARRQPEQAVEHFLAGLRDWPESVALRVNLADAYRLLGRDEEGVALLEAARSEQPEMPALRESLALAYVRVGRHQDAVPELRRLTELLADAPRPMALLALTLEHVGQTDEAERLKAQAKERFPDDPLVQSL